VVPQTTLKQVMGPFPEGKAAGSWR